jgi:putative ABC transport system ATP-binding protein
LNLKLKDLFKIYKQGKLEVVALNKVNLSIYAGEIVVIMGPSGSGKTTLINCIAGMEQPTAGSVLLRNYEVTKLNDYGKELLLKHEVGIVYQFFNLIPNLTAKNNIELPMMLAKQKKTYIKKRVKILLKMVGLEGQANQHPNTLSGGEKQRVGIAMALANDPPIILADEPTANIDSISAENLADIFRNYIKKNPDKSVVIVTHDDIMRKIADRTLILKDGKIIRELVEKTLKKEKNEDSLQEKDDKLSSLSPSSNDTDPLLPSKRVINYSDIKECQFCGSSRIHKMYNEKGGRFKIWNEQLITQTVVSCEECYKMSYVVACLSDLQDTS